MQQHVINELDDGMDVYLYMTTGQIVPADTVHHIVPLRDDWNRRLEASNLMSLSGSTHSYIEQLYKKDKVSMEHQLTEMLQNFRKISR